MIVIPGMAGLSLKNPLHNHWRVIEGGLYSLGELSEYVEPGKHKKPKVPEGIGRNCDLFHTLGEWSYRAIRQGWPDYPQFLRACTHRAQGFNSQFEYPLPYSEVKMTWSNGLEQPS